MASIQSTNSNEGEIGNNQPIDYVELLRVSLKHQKLMYIADAIFNVEQMTLQDLLQWKYEDIVEQTEEIHNAKDNDYKIKVSHRNKFANTVVQVAQQKKKASINTNPQSSTMKLLIIGKEEEECIEEIQSGQQYMDQALVKTKELFNNLKQNNDTVKKKLATLCVELKKSIDIKQDEMNNIIDAVYQNKLQKLNKRDNVTKKSAKVVAKFYNDYESYLMNEKLTKLDRKNKLLAAKNAINVETQKIKQYKNNDFNMDVALNKDAMNSFFDHCFSLDDIGSDKLDLPILKPEHDRNNPNKLKWKHPKLNVHFPIKDEDDEKKQNHSNIRYSILYRKKNSINEDWNCIHDIVNVTEYVFRDAYTTGLEIKMLYTVCNAIKSPLSSPVFIGYCAKWSSQYKGNKIILTENDTKATQSSGDQIVRAVNPIKKGMNVKINFKWYSEQNFDLIGVISSEYNGTFDIYAWHDDVMKHSYGIATDNNHYFDGKRARLGWNADIPARQETKIEMVVNYSESTECVLTFYVNGQFKGPSNSTYSMKLPAGKEWYPVVGFDDDNNWCKMEIGYK